jgi:hypothetical protein
MCNRYLKQIFLFSLIAIAGAQFSLAKELSPRDRFVSPDGRLVAICAEADQTSGRVGLIMILEKATGRHLFSVETNPPVFALRWLNNSKALVFVQAIAGGSVAQVIYDSTQGWKAANAEPREGDDCTVTQLRLQGKTIMITYKIAIRNQTGRFYSYSFSFHPDSTAHTSERRHEMSEADYFKLGGPYGIDL